MTTGPICPVVLAGGTGTRLWPISRAARPKQFARLAGAETLLSATVRRLEDVGCGAPVFVTRDAYRWAVDAEAKALGLVDHRIVLEPEPRGTAAAIAVAAEMIATQDPDILMLVVPSDQIVRDTLALADAVARGSEAARDGGIVVFGIKPSAAETGFGYIEASEKISVSAASRYVRFVEKPDRQRAQEMVESGRYLWNSGMFLATARTFRDTMMQQAPAIAGSARASLSDATQDMGFLRLGPQYLAAPSEAFDRAVMERTEGWVVPLDAGWSDLGTWQGVWATSELDENRCATTGAALAVDCKDSLLMSSDAGVELVGIGLTNIAAVATNDAVLVVNMDDSQSVAAAVEALGKNGVRQAETFASDFRPWGYYEVLAKGPRFQVKSIVVHPGASLSLQSHQHRAEHWVVVEGTATVTIGDQTRLVTENQSVYIPLGARHRLANEGRQPLRLIEVQTGTYLEEDDIVRYDDVYSRV